MIRPQAIATRATFVIFDYSWRNLRKPKKKANKEKSERQRT